MMLEFVYATDFFDGTIRNITYELVKFCCFFVVKRYERYVVRTVKTKTYFTRQFTFPVLLYNVVCVKKIV